MTSSDLIRLSVRQIFRNKRRYKGAILGISLGIAGLMTVLTIGDSVESSVGLNLEVLGSATIIKAEWDWRQRPIYHIGTYHEKDVERVRKLPGVLAVSAAVWGRAAYATFRKYKKVTRVGGVEASFFRVRHAEFSKGRPFSRKEVDQRAPVCVIGRNVDSALFGHVESSINQQVVINGDTVLRVVGVIGGAEDPDFMSTVFMPITVARAKMRGMDKIGVIYVRAVSWDKVPELHGQMEKLLKTRQPGYAESMLVQYYPERIEAISTIVLVFKCFVYASIAVTLLLGGLGITNVMLAVVAERTQEIGLRKAVGATDGMILSQFLFESLTVSTMGAVVGMAVGLTAIEVLKRAIETDPNYLVLFLSIVGAAFIGIFLGVVSGVIPARKASRLNPVDAMRFE